MSLRNEQLRDEQAQDVEERRFSFQKYIKRLILGFFAIMLALTFVSRAADSALVAQVEVTSAKKGELTFSVQGSGTITDHAKQYLDVYAGVHVSQVLVEEGQRVDPGDALFQYNPDDLKEKLEEANDEVLRAEINYRKAKLSYEVQTADTAEEAAELSLERAELDLITAEQDLQLAKDKVNSQRQDSYEAAQKSYEAALKDYHEQEDKKNRAVDKANHEVQDAEETRSDLNAEREKSEVILSEYKEAVESLTEPAEEIVSGANDQKTEQESKQGSEQGSNQVYYNLSYMISSVDHRFFSILNSLMVDSESSQVTPELSEEQDRSEDGTSEARQEEIDKVIKAEENIFRDFYGDKEYEVHLKAVDEAEQNLERKKEDYSCAILIPMENGRNLSTEEKITYIRMYEDAADALAELTKEDLKLREVITAYGNAILKKEPIEIETTYAALFALIYQEDEEKTQEIKAADKAIMEAKELLEETTTEWENTMTEAQKQIEELQAKYEQESKVFEQITEGTYDYSEDVQAEEKQVESAARAVSDAKVNVEKAKESDGKAAQQKQKEEELQVLDYELYEMDLEEKQKTAEVIDQLLNQEGMVTAPVAGYAAEIGVIAGSVTSGSEIVAIAVEECSFQAFLTKDEAKRIELGDEARIRIGNSNQEIVVPVTGIGAEDPEGKIEITGIMPEGEYAIGTALTYQLTKESKQYQQTIPIGALHSDSHGNYYVLVPEEKNTVLGNELVARRIAITLIDKDDTTAAIEGEVYSVDIISGSNKNIEEGDRVRKLKDE